MSQQLNDSYKLVAVTIILVSLIFTCGGIVMTWIAR